MQIFAFCVYFAVVLAIGIEHVDDIIAALDEALKSA